MHHGYMATILERMMSTGANRRPALAVRFGANVKPLDLESCWEYGGTIRAGLRGQIRDGRRVKLAHRVSFELAHGYGSADGLDVCHRCDNPICVNPVHLWLGSRRENPHDMRRKGRGNWQVGGIGATAVSFTDAELSEAELVVARWSSAIERARDENNPFDQFWLRVDKRGERDCWEWRGGFGGEYGIYSWNGVVVRASRFSWELANGVQFPRGLMACHTCDNPPCVNPKHLYAGTSVDNAGDITVRGRRPKAAKRGRERKLKMSESDCELAKAELVVGANVKAIAARFGVSEGVISEIGAGVYGLGLPASEKAAAVKAYRARIKREKRERVIEMRESGLTMREIGSRIGMSEAGVGSLLRDVRKLQAKGEWSDG